jgi:hypothetical protein
MVTVPVGDHHEVESAQVDSKRPYIPRKDLPVVAGIEQDPFATVFDQRGEAPIPGKARTSAERVVENGDPMRSGSWRGVHAGSEAADTQEPKGEFMEPHWWASS